MKESMECYNQKDSSLMGHNSIFSHIYVEEKAWKYDMTGKILEQFSDSEVITIEHYMDIFNRPHQSFGAQKKSPSLILAVKKNNYIYPGAKVCQSFDNEYFYYASLMMNCLFDCEYCYLQGMYPSGNVVIYVNVDDYFTSLEGILKQHSAYVCVSYDSDLLSVEKITGIVDKWCDFCKNHKNLSIEIRTKSGSDSFFRNRSFPSNVIFAWTLSPQDIIKCYEHRTGSLENRLKSAQAAQEAGAVIRLCFDPMIYVKDYKKIYGEMIDKVFRELDASRIKDCSIGVFRISSEYIKKMRRQRTCAITEYPYAAENGVCSYGEKRNKEMMEFAREQLIRYLPEEKIFEYGENS